jgi:hypothetical protein
MSVERLDHGDVASGRKRVLVHAESIWIGEVGAQLTKELENALVVDIPSDGHRSLQWCIGHKRLGTKWRWVALRQEWSCTSGSWS